MTGWGPASCRTLSRAVMGMTGHKKSRAKACVTAASPCMEGDKWPQEEESCGLCWLQEPNSLASALAVERIRLSGWEVGSLLEVQAGRKLAGTEVGS